ncbi:MAG: Crp/Fnr family transcriptional regulator [Chloroflexi bacterium]|nr:Crp/Fnr family transcriptional regulator [Chloroflexota bacterium]
MHHLSTIELFQDLSEREQEELDRITTMSTVRRGKVLYRPDEMGEVLFILKSGRVQLYRISPEGKKLVITTLDNGSLFGEMALLGQQMHNTFAEAMTDCTICVMSRSDLERLILQQPLVALRMLEITGRRLRDAESRLEDMAFKSIPARISSVLLRLAGADRDEISGFTHQDLAEMVGTYRETATQVLNDMKSKGLIDIGRKRLLIRDRAGVEAMAEG